jgi:omega-amidase
MKIALISLDQIWLDKPKNLAKCAKLLAKASEFSASLAIFPEMTLTGYSVDTLHLAEEYEDSRTVKEFKRLAKENHIAIIFGLSVVSGEETISQKAKNRAVCVDKNGEIVAFYDKIHPFSLAGEEKFFDSGDTLATAMIEGARISFSICYDLRFAELFTTQADKTDIFVNISNWPAVRVDNFTSLLNARAVETQAFVIGVNRIGEEPSGAKYIKSSACFDPSGAKMPSINSSKELNIIEIDIEEVSRCRAKFSAIKDRQPRLYKDLY